MKKENKQNAKARRAAERNRKEMMHKLKVFAPVLLLVVVVIGLGIWKFGPTGQPKEDPNLITKPVFKLDDALTYYADIDIKDYGKITVELNHKVAPVTVTNFVSLAQSGFYDGLTFHRIIEDFMMQGGAPNGSANGTANKKIIGEFTANGHKNDLSHTRGAISMARTSNYNGASCQFFIVHEDSKSLDGLYAVFGYVTEGMDVVDAVCESAEPTDNNGTIPKDKQPVIKSIKIRVVGEPTPTTETTEE